VKQTTHVEDAKHSKVDKGYQRRKEPNVGENNESKYQRLNGASERQIAKAVKMLG